MSIRSANYNVIRIDLTLAGEHWIEQQFDFLRVVRFEDAAKAEILTGRLELMFGRMEGERMPLGTNAGLSGTGDVARITWNAQPGVFAIIVASQGDLKIDTPPSRTSVSASLTVGTALRTIATTVTTAATIVSNIAGRQSVILRNDGATDCFIGGATVAATGTTKGLLLAVGGSITLDKQNAAIYAICASGSTSIVAVEEY